MLARDRRARRADRAPRPRGQLLAVGPDRAVRAVLGAVPRPRPGLRRRERPPRATTPSASSSSGTWCSCSTSCTRTARSPRCRAEHRHRHGPGPDGGDPPGRPVGLRDRPVPAADRVRRGAARGAGTARTSRPRARCAMLADHGRGGDLPDGRRRGALQRGPRLHPAPHPAPRDPAGPRARDRGRASCRDLCERVVEEMGDAYPELRPRGATIARWARAEEEGFGAHARAGRAAAGRPDRAPAKAEARPGCPPRTRSGCTTPTASRSR